MFASLVSEQSPGGFQRGLYSHTEAMLLTQGLNNVCTARQWSKNLLNIILKRLYLNTALAIHLTHARDISFEP